MIRGHDADRIVITQEVSSSLHMRTGITHVDRRERACGHPDAEFLRAECQYRTADSFGINLTKTPRGLRQYDAGAPASLCR